MSKTDGVPADPERAEAASESTPTGGPRNRWSRRVVSAAVVVGVLALIAWAIADRAGGDSRARAVGDAVIEEYPVEERPDSEPFQAQLLSGDRLDTEDLAGEVVVYNVWGSWCAPCVAEAPDLKQVADEFAGRVVFVGINVRDNDASARAFERKYEIPYDSIISADSATAMGAFQDSLAAAAVPTTLIVDPEGRVAARAIGQVTSTTLRDLLEPVLAEAG